MKVSWRNAGEKPGTFEHFHIFTNGEKRDGKNPREYMTHLIRASTASEVALNDKPIWKLGTSNYADADAIVLRAMMGEPREASILITVDYNTQGDWLDSECRACGFINGNHRQKCSAWVVLNKGWLDIAQAASGR